MFYCWCVILNVASFASHEFNLKYLHSVYELLHSTMRNTRYSNTFYVRFLVLFVLIVHIFLFPFNRTYTEEEFIKKYPQINSDWEAKNARLNQLIADSNTLVPYTEYDDLREEDLTDELIHRKAKEKAKEHNIPILLWWNDLYPDITDFRSYGDHICLLTKDRSVLTDDFDTIFIMFYGSGIHWEDLPLPRTRDHIWGLLHDESSKNNVELNFIEVLSLFNYTSTFSRHSDLPITAMYLPSLDYLTQPLTYPPSTDTQARGSVLYIHSDCQVPTYRDLYTQELMKHITVDAYGACLNNKQFPEHLRDGDNILKYQHEELYKFINGYKFTLAFENSRCDDYITEKLWRPFHMRSIPIYHGAKTVKDWVPSPHSVIYAEDFESPKALAKYLHYLEHNQTAYEEYFSYKNKVTNERLIDALRGRDWSEEGMGFIDAFHHFMCQKANEFKAAKKQNRSIPLNIADITHYDCEVPNKRISSNLLGEHFDWYGVYKNGHDHAKQLREQVIGNTHY